MCGPDIGSQTGKIFTAVSSDYNKHDYSFSVFSFALNLSHKKCSSYIPCRFFRENGFCKFGTSCRYSHRVSREIEENNEKIESLEKVTDRLSKQVAEQDAEIKALKLELYEIENVHLKSLRKQIDDLIKSNDEKEKAIKKLEEDFIELENNIEFEDNNDDDEGEDVELQEKETNLNEKEEVEHPTFVVIALEHSDKAYKDIEKLRKNSREAKVIVQNLDKELSELAFVYGQTHSEEYQIAVSGIKRLSKSTEAKKDKDSCLVEIVRCKKLLKTITL